MTTTVAASGLATTGPLMWWERRWFAAALVLLSALPLLWPDIPPLLDLPGHMGRYQVQLDLATSPDLQRYYTFEWRLIGNMGIDLLVMPLARVFGTELAVKLIVLTIPPLTVAGFLLVAREVHGRVPPTALFAIPFAYNFPFLFGFVNFALAMALAFLAFGLWLRLARLGRPGLRAAVCIPISLLLWVCHAFGWGTLGALAFSAELVRQYDRGHHFVFAGLRGALHCLALAPPIILMLMWRSESGGTTGGWLNFDLKLEWLYSALRDRWQWFDIGSLALCGLLVGWALLSRRVQFSRNLAASFLFLAILFVALPRVVFGSAYADMRLAPYLIAVILLSIRFRPGFDSRVLKGLAAAGLALVLVRTAGTTLSNILYDRSYDRELAALEHVPRGARMVTLIGRDCREPWAMTRLLHISALAMVRKHAFSNDQWTMAGAQMLNVRYRDGWPFMRDPSQQVTSRRCGREPWWTANEALHHIPRDSFDYVWLIQPPRFDPRHVSDLRMIWRDGNSALFKVEGIPERQKEDAALRRTPISGSARRSAPASRR